MWHEMSQEGAGRVRGTGHEDVSGRQVRGQVGDRSGGTGREDWSVGQVREIGQEGRVMRAGQWDDRGGV